jgi:UDP-N-acetylmuramoylalanine--D-glutamate ligase
MLRFDGQDVLVLGLGRSGTSAANFCAARGARVVAADERPVEALAGVGALAPGIQTAVGGPFPDPAGFDLVVPSPGVPPARYRTRARRVWGDVEIAYRALPVPIVAVTGTNGKSTTTCLVEALLRGAGLRARAAGNLGEPALELVGLPLDVAVLEVSSFQLETTESFRPRVAVILNITPDHLDRHGSFAAYREAKARILANQQPEDAAVLNVGDPEVRALADRVRGRSVPFRIGAPLERGAWLDAEAVVLCGDAGPAQRVSLAGLRLRGLHNRENAVAALAAVWAAGADVARAAAALPSFRGLPHRMEEVARIGGVAFVNDSKATNPGAAHAALAGAGAPVVWIAGGRGKGLDFAELADTAAKTARAAVLIGEAADSLRDALGARIETRMAASLEEAVGVAAALAQPGDVVLLAPACASFDQFRNFEDRGERFRTAVAALPAAAERC